MMNFLSSLAFNLVIPFMTVYLAQKMNPALAGLGVGAGVVIGLVAGLYSGYIADRIGRKKVMLMAEGVWLAAFALMACINSPWADQPYVTLALVAVVSACWSLYEPAASAMLLDVTTPESRKFMYSFFYWCNNLAIALGGAVGALFFGEYLFVLLLVLTASGLIQFIVTYFFIEETKVGNKEGFDAGEARKQTAAAAAAGGLRSILVHYREVWKDKLFVLYITASMLIVSMEFHLTGYVGVRLAGEMSNTTLLNGFGQHWTVDGYQMLGMLRTENTVLVVLLSFLTPVIMKRFKDRNVLYIGFLIYITGFTYIAFGNSPLALLIFMLLATLGEVMYVPVKQAYMANIIPDHARSSYMFVNGLTYKGATLISALGVSAGGWLPPSIMAAAIGCIGFGGLLLFRFIMPALERRSAQTPA
ncbi:MFS transporter [Paenibacillus turpanensis]|uniref:MFS transporter n=1 Tax=Paenibacillus turpanensis TaxID=2689078 RepID=UPI00140B11F6|nr:MFS transporter [Paenibacillus turpanensis]